MDNTKRIGRQTVELKNRPKIISATSVVGPKEGEGPLGSYFDITLKDDKNGKETYEKAESSILYTSITESIKKGNLTEDDIDYLLCGDLQNQITSSNFAAREIKIPFIGLYGACSTFSLSLGLGAMFIDGGFADYVVTGASSHFSSAERQFRFPLEYGSQRAITSQWTVTGAGTVLLGREGNYPEITHITTGKVKDYGVKDVNNMGAAMAPSAVDTIYTHLQDTGRDPSYYDCIATGDLGKFGRKVTETMLKDLGYDVSKMYVDCGESIYDNGRQDTYSGGSGCGCSASVFTGYFYKQLLEGKISKILIISTGALMSPTTSFQGESVPGIAHAVAIEFNNRR